MQVGASFKNLLIPGVSLGFLNGVHYDAHDNVKRDKRSNHNKADEVHPRNREHFHNRSGNVSRPPLKGHGLKQREQACPQIPKQIGELPSK